MFLQIWPTNNSAMVRNVGLQLCAWHHKQISDTEIKVWHWRNTLGHFLCLDLFRFAYTFWTVDYPLTDGCLANILFQEF